MHDTHHIKNIEYKTYQSKTLSKQMMEAAPEKCFLQEIFSIYGVLFRARTAQADMENLFCFQQNSLETYRAEKAFVMELKNILFYLSPQYRVQKLEDLEDVSNFIHSARKKNMLVSQQKYLYLLLPLLSGSDMVHSQFTEKNTHGKTFQKSFQLGH